MPEVLGLRELGLAGDDVGPAPAPGSPAADGDASADDDVAEAAGSGRGASWRRRAAAGVVVVLFLAVVYLATSGRTGPAVSRGAAGPVSTASVGTPAEGAAKAALDAWARFATTGVVDGLDETFDPAGPQLARLRSEAPMLAARPAGGAAYSFAAGVRGVNAGRDGDEVVVAADVVLSRTGEADQHFAWELVMRRDAGRWRLWTVRDLGHGSASPAIGGAP